MQKIKFNQKFFCLSSNSNFYFKKLSGEDGVPGGDRTHDHLLRRQMLYPLSYRNNLTGIYFNSKMKKVKC